LLRLLAALLNLLYFYCIARERISPLALFQLTDSESAANAELVPQKNNLTNWLHLGLREGFSGLLHPD
jgi:hypothetical protein